MIDTMYQEILSILTRRSPSVAEGCVGKKSLEDLPKTAIELIMDELGLEFMDFGLRADQEPNEYGLHIESLINECAKQLP